ncbi:eukaryotic translation initiation factor 2-alpha kinase 1-like [Phymastichus coffea]|uniref:eukaryotic translation initiation factor 2-alpha kinase 1-like n=1 Tax=Phymastichus coffea TaxID=108790 RepID=UPI00273A770E|nr:eukaryotic translation initiation factor 2-alpha kinase 1-like [Phymastichus coffea]XP_058806599.1 eukaryotic translation initiation factor 2-alpha kinase 1-like [Phymastichus coffea]XP_058806600.1 eukaryotic translation initiation factor 2-alpha kinase 1-like [Phymastichus coffea]
MEEQLSDKNNPWIELSTLTNFDKGEKVLWTSNKKIVQQISSSILIKSLINQLCTLLENDPDQSKRLYLLLCKIMRNMKLIDPSCKAKGLEIVQERYVNAVCQLIKVARATIAKNNNCPIPRPFVTHVSFYQDQFQETGFIAVGGFGSVFKAVHKLDEVEYAIKKIIVKSGKVETIINYLEEVKTLAKLNHTNIVSYKQAWIESMSTPCMMQLPSTSESESSEICKSKVGSNDHSSLISYKSQTCKSSSAKVLQHNKKEEQELTTSDESNLDIVSFRDGSSDNKQNIIEINSKTSTEESISSDESFEDRRICRYSAQTNQCTILYIQMALCERTLRQWLDDRTEPTSILLIADIAAQILCGLNYIHSLKVVHHDIKPSNIFISTSGKLQIQLGDFGLACPLQRGSHDTIVGTCMYAAPEQLQGECNPKSDIYSLGIVLLELLIPMQTSMECIETIKILQNGGISKHLLDLDVKWINIVSQLIKKNSANRPCTSQLLQDLKIDKDLTISKLLNENSRLQLENDLLQNKNKQQNEMIENQKGFIKELQARLNQLKK